MTDDVSGTTARAPVASFADASGRHVAAQLSIRRIGSLATGPVPARARPGAFTGAVTDDAALSDDLLAATARSRVAAAFADDPSAVLLDASRWAARTTRGREVRAVRLDVVEHDLTTPVVRTSVLVPCSRSALGPGGIDDMVFRGAAGLAGTTRTAGVVEVSATVPVAHHRALVAAVEASLSDVVVDDETVRDADTVAPGQVGGSDVPPGWLSALDRGRWYVPPEAWLGAEELEVFVRGSHRLAPSHRAGPARAGLVDGRGTSTPTGDVVRRAVHRPDLRVHLRVAHPADGSELGSASLVVDRLGSWAVLRATPPPVAVRGGQPVAAHRYVEVVDLAAAPARVASWVGTGPGRSSSLADGLELTMLVRRSGQVWGQQSTEVVRLGRGAAPRETWQQVLAALV